MKSFAIAYLLVLCVSGHSQIFAGTWTYNYEGLPYLDTAGIEHTLTGEVIINGPTNKGVTIYTDQVWERGSRNDVFYGGWEQQPDEIRLVDFTLTNGIDTFRIDIVKDEPQRNNRFYTNDVYFSFSTDSEGAVSDWDIRSVGSAQQPSSTGTSYQLRHEDQRFSSDPMPRNYEYFADFDLNGGGIGQDYLHSQLNPWTQETTPPEHIIVLSHGLSPDKPTAEKNYLIDLKQSILSRLASDDIDLDTVHFVTQTWDEAYVPSAIKNYEGLSENLPPLPLAAHLHAAASAEAGRRFSSSYNDAYNGTVLAGERLATEISTLYEDLLSENGSTPTIHMIGHSLGTIVNAEAVSILNKNNVDIDLVTILDSPRQSSLRVAKEVGIKFGKFRQTFASFDSSLLFYNKMPEGSVEFVENFYGGDEFDVEDGDGFTPAFGQPIAGTLPAIIRPKFSGKFFPHSDHTDIWNSDYRNLINNDDSWHTPALYDNDDFFRYRKELTWNPSPLLDYVVNEYNNLSLVEGAFLSIVSVNWLVGDSIRIDSVHRKLGTIAFENSGIRAISNSPSAFSAEANLDTVLGLEFSYLVEDAQTGILSLAFGDQALWSIDLSVSGTLLSDTVYISSLDLGGAGELVWTYDSDEVGSSALFSNLRLLVGTVVPEPSSVTMCMLAACLVGTLTDRKYLLRSCQSQTE